MRSPISSATAPIVSPLLGERLRTPQHPMRRFFRNGEVGAWYDPSDLSTLYQDSAGTTPVTAPEQPVGLMLDKSGNGYHAWQDAAASKPVVSARVNRFLYSEDLTQPEWNKVELSCVSTEELVAGSPAQKLIPSTASANHYISQSGAMTQDANFTWRLESTVKAAGYDYYRLQGKTKNNDYPAAVADLANGTIQLTRAPAGANAQCGITARGDGFYDIWLSWSTLEGAADLLTFCGPTDTPTGSLNFTGDGVSGVLVSRNQLMLGDKATRYQRVGDVATDPADYDWQGWPLYLRTDGVDDWMQTAPIPWASDKLLAVVGVRKMSDSAAGFVVESGASSAVNGSFNLAAPSISGTLRSCAFAVRGSGGTSQYLPAPDNAHPAPSPMVITGIVDMGLADTRLSVDGDLIASSSGGYNGESLSSHPLYLFSRAGSSLFLNGDFYGMTLAAGAHAPALIDSAERYLASKMRPPV